MLVAGTRLVTLTGPGGIGKSRLAIAAATALAPRFADGAVFVDLSAVHDPGAVPNTHGPGDRRARHGRRADHREAGDRPARPAACCWCSTTSSRCWMPRRRSSRAAQRGPGHRRASSRAARCCGSAVEQSFELGPPGRASPATALFVERAHAVKPDFEITPDERRGGRRAICEALDGVPLALELAAARIRVLSAAGAARTARPPAAVLVGGARDLPQRQQTLRSTIEWSTQLLGESERRLLAWLGVFEGGFTLEAAEYVVGAATRIRRPTTTRSALSQRSSTAACSASRTRSDRPRFSMLATVREYALEQLTADGCARADARACTRSTSSTSATGSNSSWRGRSSANWVLRLGDERDNLRAAVRYLLDQRDWAPGGAPRLDALRLLVGRRPARRGARMDGRGRWTRVTSSTT